jgi:hypothetical protein
MFDYTLRPGGFDVERRRQSERRERDRLWFLFKVVQRALVLEYGHPPPGNAVRRGDDR